MLETGQSLSARSALTMPIPATLLCRGEQEKEGRQEEGKEGAMEDYPCNRLTMGEVSHKLGTVSTYLGLRLSLSCPSLFFPIRGYYQPLILSRSII